jgi:3-dehydro-L-gulonate 2-dehydrogenase
VSEISQQKAECNVSQVFIAIDIRKLNNFKTIAFAIQQIIDDYHQSIPEKTSKIVYPGERVLSIRAENLAQGIPVMKTIWDEILSFQI